jgi:hypothetical protein
MISQLKMTNNLKPSKIGFTFFDKEHFCNWLQNLMIDNLHLAKRCNCPKNRYYQNMRTARTRLGPVDKTFRITCFGNRT